MSYDNLSNVSQNVLIGIHVYYIGGRIKGLKIGETQPKSWLLASLQFPKGSPSLHIKSLINFKRF
jgi:hypothetical protein